MAAGLKTFSFVTTWHFDASVEQVWDILVDPASWPDWWDGLESSSVQRHHAGEVGSRSRLVWRAPLGYRLHLELTLTTVDSGQGYLAFDSDGDLVGQGSCVVRPDAGQTEVRITWVVAPTKPWMRALGTLLSPIFRANHATLMQAGQRGLVKKLNYS